MQQVVPQKSTRFSLTKTQTIIDDFLAKFINSVVLVFGSVVSHKKTV